jgi:hypothetical protein
MMQIDLINKAYQVVNGEREENYGHPALNFTKIAKIWSGVLDVDVTPAQVALCMQGVKLARESHSHKEDNLVDGIGYWLAYAKMLEVLDEI